VHSAAIGAGHVIVTGFNRICASELPALTKRASVAKACPALRPHFSNFAEKLRRSLLNFSNAMDATARLLFSLRSSFCVSIVFPWTRFLFIYEEAL